MSEEKKAIVFGAETLTPEQQQSYRDKINMAKSGAKAVNALKSSDPVGGERVPITSFKALEEQRAMRHQHPSMSESGGVQPRPAGSPVLSAQTEQQLKDMAAIKEAASAAKEEVEEEKAKTETADDLMEMFEGAARGAPEAELILVNKKRREEIENRCKPMKFEDLLYKNEVKQVVPIRPNEFEPTFRSLTPQETLFVKKYIANEQTTSDQYLLEKYNICLLTCSLYAINGSELPDHRNADGEPVEKLFEAKLKNILKKSGYIVADLGINYNWFDIRVRKLITTDGLKNG